MIPQIETDVWMEKLEEDLNGLYLRFIERVSLSVFQSSLLVFVTF